MPVYHLELRNFPHVVCRFNQSEAQLRAIVLPWVREEWIEEGERKWNANDATLTVLEGPKLSMPDLAMGKGWRNAQRRGRDVTERVLAAAREATVAGGTSPAQAPSPAPPGAGAALARGGARDLGLLADSLGLELLALLHNGPVAPARAWRLAQERLAERGGVAAAADALALAERAVGSLLERGLVVLKGGGAGADRGVSDGGELPAPERQGDPLAAIETWAREDPSPVVLARKG
jgi:hypothetical protein